MEDVAKKDLPTIPDEVLDAIAYNQLTNGNEPWLHVHQRGRSGGCWR